MRVIQIGLALSILDRRKGVLSMSDLLRCCTTFLVSLGGKRVKVRQGDIVHSDDPVVELAREHFDALENHVKCFGHEKRPVRSYRPVEQATAVPGEKRTTVRRSKKSDEPVKAEEKKDEKDA